jgi:DNA-binding SARP family transcriptional activator
MLQVYTFGGFSLTAGGRLVHGEFGAGGRRLSAYLFTFPNAIHRRAKLVDLFWPEQDPDQARAALSTALWRLRRLLATEKRKADPKIVATSHDLMLEIRDDNIVDAHQFDSIIADAFRSGDLTQNLASLDRAIDLYKGPFLDGEEDHWILEQRERLHCLYVRALTAIMHRLSEQDRYEDALACGRRILAADPMREAVQRCVMLLYLLNGQRREAIRQFERCMTVLRDDCDVEPMPETKELDAMIRSGDVFGRLPQLRKALFKNEK